MANRFPFFDLSRQYKELKPQLMQAVEKVFDKQAFVLGDEVAQFEKELAQYVGAKHAITCANGTDALVLALKSLDIGAGDDVLTVPFSFFASTSSILLAGANPVFVDVEPNTYNLDPSKLEKALTKKTKAIMPVHLFGQCADMEGVMSFAKAKGLMVVEDFAQSIGATYSGKGAGSMGTMGATSFYPTKNLGAAGEGGAVTTNDDAIAEKAKLLRVHGMKVRYTHDLLGWNSRMDAIQAAVLRIKLPHLNTWVARRQKLARHYHDLLGHEKRIVLPATVAGRTHVWNQFTILVEGRDEVRRKLETDGIPTDIFYPKTIAAQPVMQKLGFKEENMAVSVESARKALALPIFPELTDDEQKQVAASLLKALN